MAEFAGKPNLDPGFNPDTWCQYFVSSLLKHPLVSFPTNLVLTEFAMKPYIGPGFNPGSNGYPQLFFFGRKKGLNPQGFSPKQGIKLWLSALMPIGLLMIRYRFFKSHRDARNKNINLESAATPTCSQPKKPVNPPIYWLFYLVYFFISLLLDTIENMQHRWEQRIHGFLGSPGRPRKDQDKTLTDHARQRP